MPGELAEIGSSKFKDSGLQEPVCGGDAQNDFIGPHRRYWLWDRFSIVSLSCTTLLDLFRKNQKITNPDQYE